MSGSSVGAAKQRARAREQGMDIALGKGLGIIHPTPAAYFNANQLVEDFRYVPEPDVTEYLNGRTIWAHRLDRTPECVSPEMAFIEVRLEHLEDWPKMLQRGVGG